MDYKNLLQVAEYLEGFEKEHPLKDFSMEDFCYWMLEKVTLKPQSYQEMNIPSTASVEQQSPDVQISILIGRMAKYARVYSKKVLNHTQLSGLDDYGFMATLMFRESMTKSELTHYNLMDSITSGADIIKRLLKEMYIEEFDDPADKRSKRVRMTPKGRSTMFQVFSEMNTVSDIITGNLQNHEKWYLLQLLKKLDVLHHSIYHCDRKEELETIRNKYIIDNS